MKKRILIALACMALLISMAVFTVQADADVNAQIDFATTTTCPACKQEGVTWKPLPQITAESALEENGHYYVPAGGVNNGGNRYKNDASHKNACIHLNNNNITATGQNVFNWGNAGTLRVFGQGNVSSANNTIMGNSASIHLYGGTYGGNNAVYFYNDSAKVYVYDGATVNGVLQLASGHSLTVYGGTINSINLQKNSAVVPAFSGNPKATITVPAGKTITIGELTGDAKLTINAVGDFTINGDDTAIARYVAEGKIVSATAGETIGKSGDVYRSGHFVDCPHCPGTGLVEFTQFTALDTAPTTGHFYLADDCTKSSKFVLNSGSPDFVLDLNSKTLTMNGRFMIRGGSKVSIFDSGKNGTIKSTGTDAGTAGFAQMNEGTLNIYGGTIQEAETTKAYLDGFIVMEKGPAKLNISGGNIIGGDLGTINMKNAGEITMSGGTISGGSAENGGNVNMSAGTFTMSGGTITSGNATNRGGNVYVTDATFTVTGGALIGGTAKNGGNVAVGSGGELNIQNTGKLNGGTASNQGGALYASSGTVEITGGTIENGKATGENSGDGKGGNLWIYSGATLTLTGGTVQNGEAINGGNLYSQGDTITIGANVDLIGGEATNRGGSIYVDGGTVTNQGSISGGHSDKNGGNVAVATSGKFALSGNGEVTLGTADGNGGNIYISSGSATLSGGTVSDGTADIGGNLWLYTGCKATLSGADITGGTAHTGPSVAAQTGGEVEMTGGSVTAATCDPVRGMAMYFSGSSTLKMSGGTVYSNSTVADHGGIYLLNSCGTLSGNAKIVTYHNDVEGAYGNGIAVWSTGDEATLTLDGNASVMGEEGHHAQNIYVAYYEENPAKLIVKDTFTGEAGITFAPTAFAPEYGMTIPATFGEVAPGASAFTGKLYLSTLAGRPEVVADGTNLVITGTQVVKSATEAVWYATNADAMTAVTNGQYIKLYTDAELALTKDAYVDFNGQDATVTGTAKLYGMDSANDTYEELFGFVTVSGPDVQADVTNPINGNRYLYLDVDGDATFHRLEMRVNKVNFRPSAAGIYYGAKFECDETLKNSVAEFGMVANVYADSVIEADFKNQSYEVGGKKAYPNLYTVNSKDELSGATTINGCIIANIMNDSITDPAENKMRAEMKIHGVAYISLLNADGTTTNYISNQVDYSLHDILSLIDTEANYTANADKLAAFEAKFADELALWSFDYIGKNN